MSNDSEARRPDGPPPAATVPPRERLVEAARLAFGTKGFHATTTRDIAAAAGMSPAAVYVHHPSKEALLFALSLEGHRATLAEVAAHAGGEAPVVTRLHALVRAFALREAQHHTTARIVNYEGSALSPEHRETIDVLRRRIQQVVVDLLEEGAATGELDPGDVSLTATALMGMMIDVSRWFRDEGRWRAEQVADHHATAALRIAGARPGSLPG